MLTRVLATLSPRLACRRIAWSNALQMALAYNAATTGNRASWRATAGSADGAAWGERERLAYAARHLARNNPIALRAKQAIAAHAVGPGIIPKIRGGTDAQRMLLLGLIEQHCDTTAIDADGRTNLYGLQRLALDATVGDGEVLMRLRPRRADDGLPLPFQVQLLEMDYLDGARHGGLPNGGWIDQGIEYDPVGRRVAYWLFPQHPGDAMRGIAKPLRLTSVRIPASDVLHLYRQDRPGQMRGVSWLAPVAMNLQDLDDVGDAHRMRQKIAACFAAFRKAPEPDDAPGTGTAAQIAAGPGGMATLSPGRIQNLQPGEDITFADPPGVDGLDDYMRHELRAVAAGMGITYEALTGDLSQVNFSSGRMGRLEMDRNVTAWQWLMMIPQVCQPLGDRILREARLATGDSFDGVRIEWTPPRREIIDPAREIPAIKEAIRGGLLSQSQAIREMGNDPERVLQEIADDAATLRRLGIRLDTDVAAPPAPPPALRPFTGAPEDAGDDDPEDDAADDTDDSDQPEAQP